MPRFSRVLRFAGCTAAVCLLAACPAITDADAASEHAVVKSNTAVPTVTVLAGTPNPSTVGGTVTMTATVNAEDGSTANGIVNFVWANILIGQALLSPSGVATYSQPTGSLDAGPYSVTATYLGNAGYSGSTSSPVQFNLNQATTTTKLAVGTGSVMTPATDTFTATVARTSGTGYPTGTVTFFYGSTALNTVALNASGVASYVQSSHNINPGTYLVTATYNGDPGDKTSSSSAASVTVTGTYPIAVTINPLANRHPISPLIYGTDFPPSTTYITATNSTFTRWAGDSSSNYNWTNYNTNLADDWYYANYPFNTSESLYASSQAYISGVASTGAAPFIDIVQLPWVAKDSVSGSFEVSKYGTQCATEPYWPNIGDGVETNCSTNITGNDPTDAYTGLEDTPESGVAGATVYRNQWVQALAPLFGSGPHLYGIDNEPEIWADVHRDVHPIQTTYAEMKSMMLNAMPNIKTWDPLATVAGVGSCGWYFYWNGGTGSDKTTYAGIDYNPWLLNEILWADKVNGARSMDWYDLHAYPDGTTTGYTTAQLQALTLRLARDFWDPTYQAEGGDINQQYVTYTQPVKTYPIRIPRMRALVNMIYPGTPLTFTEWNIAQAGQSDFSTALGDVDVWGAFGANELYAAARWTASPSNTPAYNSLLLYRNYDGQNHTFGTTSIQTTNNGNPDLFSSYAALNSTGTQLTVILINKDPANFNQVTLSGGGFNVASMSTYTLTQKTPNSIVAATGIPLTNTFNLPPWTAELIVMNGSMANTPTAEWSLNPDSIMVPAGGTYTLAPNIISGTGTITLSNAQQLALSNPANTTGVTLSIPTPQVTATSSGAVLVTAGATPGYYAIQVTGTDGNGTAVTQDGSIFVFNPAALLTKTGDQQSGLPGSTLLLTAKLNPGSSGGSASGASVFFTASGGTLSAREVTTNSAGDATVTLTLPATAGTVTVTAEGPYMLGHPVVTFMETAN